MPASLSWRTSADGHAAGAGIIMAQPMAGRRAPRRIGRTSWTILKIR